MERVPYIEELIESYDVTDDAILNDHFKDIESTLWSHIEDYGAEINDYGQIVSKHLQRTSAIGAEFIKTLGFSERAAQNFYKANLLHDLGKTHPCYDPNIWRTPHRPTQQEREEKREHTRLGVELIDLAIIKCPEELQTHPHIQLIHNLQLLHHERVDGSGYEGLKENEQCTIIKAICIIDAYDGDMIHRPHQPMKRTEEEALNRLKTGEKYQNAFDADILAQFIDFTLSGR